MKVRSQYNLFFGNAITSRANRRLLHGATSAPVSRRPGVRRPGPRQLRAQPTRRPSTRPASEIGPSPAGDAIYPTVDQLSDGSLRHREPIPRRCSSPNSPGARTLSGGFGGVNDPRKILTLPGSGRLRLPGRVDAGARPPRATRSAARPFVTRRPTTTPRSRASAIGSASSGSTTRASANTGFGSSPFFDIGAFEFVNLHPPEVTGVTATLAASDAGRTSTRSAARPGANVRRPQTINVTFNSPIDPNSINSNTVCSRHWASAAANTPATVHQPRRQAAPTTSRDQHPDHQPGRQRPDAADRRLPADPGRQRLAGAPQPAGRWPSTART